MKKSYNLPLLLTTAALGTGLLLSGGCNSSSSPSLSDISGQVADGYLKDADVCLDITENGICTDGDPTVRSGDEGWYTISAAKLAEFKVTDPSKYSIVAVTIPDVTIDEDDLTAPMTIKVALSSPPGHPAFISPITTMVQRRIQAARAAGRIKSIEEAKNEIKRDLGGDTDPFSNYIVNQDNNTHEVAQAITKAMGALESNYEEKRGADNYHAIISAVNRTVDDNLTSIVKMIEDGNEPDDVAETIKGAASGQVGSAITEAERDAQTTPSAVRDMFADGGTYWVDFYYYHTHEPRFEYGNLTAAADGRLQEDIYEFVDGNWNPDQRQPSDRIRLIDGSWQIFPDNAEPYSFTQYNNDGTAILVHDSGQMFTASAVEMPLTDKRLAEVLHDAFESHLTDPDQTFPQGSKAYALTVVPDEDVYSYEAWMDNGTDRNYVNYHVDGSGSVTITNLNEMLEVFKRGSSHRLHVGGRYGHFDVQFNADTNNLDIYDNGEKRTLTGSWEDITVDGQRMILLNFPRAYASEIDMDDRPFYVEIDNQIKKGFHEPAGVISHDRHFQFNKVALEAIINNLNLSPSDGTHTITSGSPADLLLNKELIAFHVGGTSINQSDRKISADEGYLYKQGDSSWTRFAGVEVNHDGTLGITSPTDSSVVVQTIKAVEKVIPGSNSPTQYNTKTAFPGSEISRVDETVVTLSGNDVFYRLTLLNHEITPQQGVANDLGTGENCSTKYDNFVDGMCDSTKEYISSKLSSFNERDGLFLYVGDQDGNPFLYSNADTGTDSGKIMATTGRDVVGSSSFEKVGTWSYEVINGKDMFVAEALGEGFLYHAEDGSRWEMFFNPSEYSSEDTLFTESSFESISNQVQ